MDDAVNFDVTFVLPLPSPLLSLFLAVALSRRGLYRYILGFKRCATHWAPPSARLCSSNEGNTTLFQEHSQLGTTVELRCSAQLEKSCRKTMKRCSRKQRHLRKNVWCALLKQRPSVRGCRHMFLYFSLMFPNQLFGHFLHYTLAFSLIYRL